MTYEEFYGADLAKCRRAEELLLALVSEIEQAGSGHDDVKPVVYCCSRIKSPDSTVAKLKTRGLPPDGKTALLNLYDTVGVRVICAFTEDVQAVVDSIRRSDLFEVLTEKNYYADPKPNGYRSYHLQLKMKHPDCAGLFAEIQVRTIATDFWATLEHKMKYKKQLKNEALIREELKRCADEIASVDLSMQTIREILRRES